MAEPESHSCAGALIEKSAEDKAEKKIKEELLKIFVRERDILVKKIDPVVEKEAEPATPPPDDSPYLKALLRMMHIETECFTSQRNFLEKVQSLTATIT